MSDYIYRLQDVVKAYNGRRVVDIANLKIARGEVFALVGPSGAGKSTLLRLMNFLEMPTSGRIRYQEYEYGPGQEVPLRLRRSVTTVFQRPILLNSSVRANVAYGLRLRLDVPWHRPSAQRHESQERVQAALEQVGLAKLAHQRAHTLSGGEAQRVALARAIVIQPDVLLLDEPTANLDPYNVGLIEDIVRGLNQTKHTTVILVTHNVFQAKRMAHRVGLLLEGEVIDTADVEVFFNSPGDSRTAAFVRGEMVY